MQILKSCRYQRWSQLRTVSRLTVRLSTHSMGQSTFSPQSQTKVDQYGPSINLRSVSRLCWWATWLSILGCERRSTSTDHQLTYGPSVDSVDGPTDFQSSVANDGRPVRTISRLTGASVNSVSDSDCFWIKNLLVFSLFFWTLSYAI